MGRPRLDNARVWAHVPADVLEAFDEMVREKHSTRTHEIVQAILLSRAVYDEVVVVTKVPRTEPPRSKPRRESRESKEAPIRPRVGVD